MYCSPEGSSLQVFCFQPNKKKIVCHTNHKNKKNQESLTIVSSETKHFEVNNGTCYYHTVATVSTNLSKFS